MIGVIADDFTGAAEIGGLGLRYGLKTEIRRSAASRVSPDLLIIAADTRSKDAGAAARDMQALTSGLRDLHPDLLYKKIDSVLRGHVLSELAAQLETMNLRRALIVPANPALGRTIRKGIYYINGTPLHEAGFGRDPEFAVSTSYVPDILERNGQGPVIIGSLDKPLPSHGLVVGEASSVIDLQKWAAKADDTTLAAGASGFFSALLDHRGFSVRRGNQAPVHWRQKKLFICGSSFSASKQIVLNMSNKGLPVSFLPAELTEKSVNSPELIEQHISELTGLISSYDYAVLSVGIVNESPAAAVAETARTIRENMAIIAAEVIRRVNVSELLLEGGATAAAVLNRLQPEQLHPEQEIAQGVLRMRVPGNEALYITVKPGSYRWPPAIGSLLQ